MHTHTLVPRNMTRKAMFVFLCIPFRIELHTLSMEYLPTKLAMVLVCILYIVFVQNWIAYLFRFYEMNKNENISDWAFCVVAVNGTWIGISCVMFTRTKTSSSEFQTCLLFSFPSSAPPPLSQKKTFWYDAQRVHKIPFQVKWSLRWDNFLSMNVNVQSIIFWTVNSFNHFEIH